MIYISYIDNIQYPPYIINYLTHPISLLFITSITPYHSSLSPHSTHITHPYHLTLSISLHTPYSHTTYTHIHLYTSTLYSLHKYITRSLHSITINQDISNKKKISIFFYFFSSFFWFFCFLLHRQL